MTLFGRYVQWGAARRALLFVQQTQAGASLQYREQSLFCPLLNLTWQIIFNTLVNFPPWPTMKWRTFCCKLSLIDTSAPRSTVSYMTNWVDKFVVIKSQFEDRLHIYTIRQWSCTGSTSMRIVASPPRMAASNKGVRCCKSVTFISLPCVIHMWCPMRIHWPCPINTRPVLDGQTLPHDVAASCRRTMGQ
jgi:hypothetical protein